MRFPFSHRLALAWLFLIAPATAAGAEAYLCAGQLSTGFGWGGEHWEIRDFDVLDKVFVVQSSAEPGAYTVTRIGDREPTHYCPAVHPSDGSLLLTCGGLGNGFAFSTRTLRFQENYGIGYVGGADGNANVPYLLIGKCTALDLRGALRE